MAAGVAAAASPQEHSRPVSTAIPSATEAQDLGPLRAVAEKMPGSRGEYNTHQLGLRLVADGTAALSAAAVVSPVITMIDKAIIENASGKRPLMTSLRASLGALLTRPHGFLASRSFLLILALYGGTYLTANLLDSAKSTLDNRPASTTSSGAAKFVATSSANLSLCLYKDSQFTRMFGTAAAARPVPRPSYALFAVRDCLTIFASFNLPPVLAPMIPLGDAAQRYVSSASVAQFLAPASVQLLSTPLHLFGLDLYNRSGGTTFADRLRKVRADWLKSSFARMARIVPAFGVGGVVNTGVRARMMAKLE